MKTQSYKFYEYLETANLKAFNMPTGVKQVYKNQYCTKYKFTDNSEMTIFSDKSKYGKNIIAKNIIDGKTYCFWKTILIPNVCISSLKYEVNI